MLPGSGEGLSKPYKTAPNEPISRVMTGNIFLPQAFFLAGDREALLSIALASGLLSAC